MKVLYIVDVRSAYDTTTITTEPVTNEDETCFCRGEEVGSRLPMLCSS